MQNPRKLLFSFLCYYYITNPTNWFLDKLTYIQDINIYSITPIDCLLNALSIYIMFLSLLFRSLIQHILCSSPGVGDLEAKSKD